MNAKRTSRLRDVAAAIGEYTLNVLELDARERRGLRFIRWLRAVERGDNLTASAGFVR